MELAPGTPLDRFVIERQLGQGAMAVVYKARHARLGTLHAIKVLQVTTPAVKQRLVQEGQLQASLRHPNIVAVSDVIELMGSPVLVMEFVDGMPLDELIRRGPLTLEQVDDLARGLIAGVAHAHKLGVLHRDLKPANVMLAMTDFGLIPKVSDFGLAKVLDAGEGNTKTRSGTTMGTPCYMAPEQIRNAKNVDRRADVWAIGTILYEMLCGVRAFDGEDLIDVFSVVSKGEYVPIAQRVPGVPERMRVAIEGALTVNKDARLADCEALLKAWTSELTPAPVEPRGPWGGLIATMKRSAGPTLAPPSTGESARLDATWSDSTLGDAAPGEPAAPPAVRAASAPTASTLGDSLDLSSHKPSNVATMQTSMADNTAMQPRPQVIAALKEAKAEQPAEPPRSRWPFVAVGVLAVIVVVAIATGGMGLLAAAGLVANSALTEAPTTPAAVPSTTPAVVQPPVVEPAPAPVAIEPPAPEPEPVEPVEPVSKPTVKTPSAPVQPTATVVPKPATPDPKPAPDPTPPPDPTPSPIVTAPPPIVEAPAPVAAPSLPKLVVKGGIPANRVTVRNAANKWYWPDDDGLPPGTYRIFLDETKPAGNLTVVAGQTVVEVTCISGEDKCTQ